MDPELLSLDDLPAEARNLIESAEHQIGQLRDITRRQADEIRARAESQASDLEGVAEEQVRNMQLELLSQLKPLQKQHLEDGNLDAALAIRDRIRLLKASLLEALEDPGNLTSYLDRDPGTQLLFSVTGSNGGTVWGTDVYTADSTLATAAVHAGILGEGEQGVVRVSLVDTQNVSFTGSYRNGIESNSYGPYPGGYRVARV